MVLSQVSLLLALSFTPNANADFIPERSRPSAEAEMQALASDGAFKGVENARLVELSTDGKGITSYELTLPGRTLRFTVSKNSNGRCGDFYEAVDRNGARLRMRDMSFAECQFRAKHRWETEVVVSNGERVSHLILGGDPEHLLLSQ